MNTNETYKICEQRDKLAIIAGELIAMIRLNVANGRFADCTIQQIDEHLNPRVEKIASIKESELNIRMKRWPYDPNPFESPDHDNDDSTHDEEMR
jgi:hypothetical protein